MIPYIEIPDLTLVSANAMCAGWPSEPIAVRPFGTLVAIAVIGGAWLSMQQVRRLGLDGTKLVDLMYWIVIGGFLGGHVLDVVFYHPESIIAQPLLLLNLANGQSSFGGFIGACTGAWLWRRARHRELGRYAEAIASSFPAAWVIGRLGCAAAHDHPGIRSDLWFAVDYPGGSRLDLGLTEAALVLPLALVALGLRRRQRAPGYFTALMCLYYAPLRFVLDFFRARDLASSDHRYLGLTPAQWCCLMLFGVGLYFSSRAYVPGRTGASCKPRRRSGEADSSRGGGSGGDNAPLPDGAGGAKTRVSQGIT